MVPGHKYISPDSQLTLIATGVQGHTTASRKEHAHMTVTSAQTANL